MVIKRSKRNDSIGPIWGLIIGNYNRENTLRKAGHKFMCYPCFEG